MDERSAKTNIFRLSGAMKNADEPKFMEASIRWPGQEKLSSREIAAAAMAAKSFLVGAPIHGCEGMPLVEWVDTGFSGALLTQRAFDALAPMLSPDAVIEVRGLPEACVFVIPELVMGAVKTETGFIVAMDKIPNLFAGFPHFSLKHCTEEFKNEWERLGFRGLNFIPAGTLEAIGNDAAGLSAEKAKVA